MSPTTQRGATTTISVDPRERITSHPYETAGSYTDTPGASDNEAWQGGTPTLPPGRATYVNNVEQAVNKLAEAAHSIEEGEQHDRRIPHASRLAPLYDVSADIQRESTPMPAMRGKQKTFKTAGAAKTQKKKQAGKTQGRGVMHHARTGAPGHGRSLPELWPWLQDADLDEDEQDLWASQSDPLAMRRIPTYADTVRIEEDDIRRARSWKLSLLTRTLPRLNAHPARTRIIFFILIVLALVALLVDTVLITVVFVRPHSDTAAQSGLPTLTLSTNKATIGQSVLLHISNFSPLAHVLLTHDVEEAIQSSAASSMIQVGSDGTATLSFLVDDTWGPGFHTIEGEDVTTRYTTSTTLQIIGAGPTRPAHLLIDNTTLDMGADLQGANTIQTLMLRNSGGGSISWAASSNRPWLFVTPVAGTFSASQVISVAVERKNLKAGDYTGELTISSNVGAPSRVGVEMSVRALPTTAGPVLVVSPPVLSFVATDGGTGPASQLLTINNPGSKPLEWELRSNILTSSGSFIGTPGSMTNWLSASQPSGVVAAGAAASIAINVDSQALLPSTYTGVLVFTAKHGALDSPQDVNVSLTILPRCGLTTSAGGLSFIAVAGQANPAGQTLGLSASASCTGTTYWHATYNAGWLTVTPARGQLVGTASAMTTVGLNIANLHPGTYSATVGYSAGHSTQFVVVQLTVQNPPAPTSPVMGVSALNLNFSNVQGQPNPPGQVVTITNTGGGPLYWHTTVNILGSSWLGVAPTGGVIPAGQSRQITVNVDTSQLTPATYVGQVVLSGTDARGVAAAGSPQTITVNLLVQPPCVLSQPSSSSLSFNAVLGNPDPNPQSVTVVAAGSCGWPLSIHTGATGSASWLNLALSSAEITASGQSVTIQVTPALAGLGPGNYSVQVNISATDSQGTQAEDSPATFTVTLTVTQPCVLQVSSPTSLSFSMVQGQAAPPAQNLSFGETGDCARPTSWKATGDAGSNSWLVLSSTSATDNGGGGALSVSVNPSGLAPGTYTGYITLSAVDGNGNAPQSSPQTITVTLVVNGS